MAELHKKIKIAFGFVAPIAIFAGAGFYLYKTLTAPVTLQTELGKTNSVGEEVAKDFLALPAEAFKQTEEQKFRITDSKSDGPQIINAEEKETGTENEYKIDLPKDLKEPMEIKLDKDRSIFITDQSGAVFSPRLLKNQMQNAEQPDQQFLQYKSKDGRKELYYSYQKDSESGQSKLKNWLIYQKGTGQEHEEYAFQNAKLKENMDGSVSVFFYSNREKQNEETALQIDGNLMERARLTLEKEGVDMENQTPDFTIPKPYYIDSQKNRHDLKWKISEGKTSLILDFSASSDQYPLALDPTLQFTAPGQSVSGFAITGESGLGYSMVAGDFTYDGRMDLAVGDINYGTNTGRVYIFYNDGSIPTAATSADVTITGAAQWDMFGSSMAAGDFNGDGRTDLAVGAYLYDGAPGGSAYIFYNDGAYPSAAASADVKFSADVTRRGFGVSMTAGDFNHNGTTDLAIGAGFDGGGISYIFYADGTNNFGTATCSGSTPTVCLAANADVIITGEGGKFGSAMTVGDFNADGRTDLVVGAYTYSTSTGRVYIFYNDDYIPTTAASADVIITGETTNNLFGQSMVAGDFNTDGKTDLAVGAHYYSSNAGRSYIFYSDGTNNFGTADCSGTPALCSAGNADVIISGEASGYFGYSMIAGDFNADARVDLAVGSRNANSSTGRAYIFYNDGSAMPTTAATADVKITGAAGNLMGASITAGDFNTDGKTDLAVGSSGNVAYVFYNNNGIVDSNRNFAGENTSDNFGNSFAAGDFNADGKTDLAVGAQSYSSSTGVVYIFYNDGTAPNASATADVKITGEAASQFGWSMVAGDFNADGRTDLAVGANTYDPGSAAGTGRAYIFYNDGSIPTTAASADVIITGEAAGNNFGYLMVAGDFDSNGKTDLAISYANASQAGRAYIFYADGTNNFGTATCSGTPALCLASNADVKITGTSTGSRFGLTMAAGDFNADGRTDLAVGAWAAASNGRTYIFYNDGSIPTTAATADVTITAGSIPWFGRSIVAGDFNSDGKTDLAVSALSNGTLATAYIFHNTGSYPATAASADVTISGTGGVFGFPMVAGDFNSDKRTDLAVGDYSASTNTGKVYIFYNDGSYPTTAATADVIVNGEATSDYFGCSMITGDFTGDTNTDLVVGAYGPSTNTGKIYFFTGSGGLNTPTFIMGGTIIKGGVDIR